MNEFGIIARSDRSTTNNRFSSGQAYSCDANGNTTAVANGQSYVYDGENKQITVSDSGGTVGQYSYDGDGRRVKKYVPATGETTVFVYDAAGKQIAEYSTIVANATDAKVNYLTADHLGSPRVNTDANGAVISLHDYHPFGEEIDGTGGRTTGLNYGDDTVRRQFTGYERDGETGLDFAQARYFASGFGRFTSPDDFLNSTRVSNPASWDLYVYVQNNPLKYVDPLGQTLEETTDRKHTLTADQKKAIEKDIRKKSGLSSIHFDEKGKLTYDASEKAKGGSAQFRRNILGAINDQKNVFQMGDYSNTRSIQFAETDPGQTNQNTGVTTYQMKIDFADFNEAKNYSDAAAIQSFSIGLNIDHEIDHKISYDSTNPLPKGGIRPDDGPNGVIEDVNIAERELGLAIRAPGSHTGTPYAGSDSRYKNLYQFQFKDQSGKDKFLRWRLEGQR